MVLRLLTRFNDVFRPGLFQVFTEVKQKFVCQPIMPGVVNHTFPSAASPVMSHLFLFIDIYAMVTGCVLLG